MCGASLISASSTAKLLSKTKWWKMSRATAQPKPTPTSTAAAKTTPSSNSCWQQAERNRRMTRMARPKGSCQNGVAFTLIVPRCSGAFGGRGGLSALSLHLLLGPNFKGGFLEPLKQLRRTAAHQPQQQQQR